MLVMQSRLRAVNVPENLAHERRKNEIESLPRYLQVVSEFDDHLYPVFRSETEPGPDYADCPWLKVSADGTPVDLLANHNGTWESVMPLAVRSRALETSLVRGQADLTLASSGTSVSLEVLFSDDASIRFLNDGKGVLTLSLCCLDFDTYNSVIPTLLAMGEANGGLVLYGIPHINEDHTGEIDGFTLWAKVPVALTSGGSPVQRSLRVNWMYAGTTPEDVY